MSLQSVRIGFFGTFYPEFQRAGNSSTGFVTVLSQLRCVEQVVVYAQEGASLPPLALGGKVDLRHIWRPDDPVSLVRAACGMILERRTVHRFAFNIYVTAFGRSRAANTVGLLLPSLVRIVSRRPVQVYFHNFIETQDLTSLGYSVSRLTRFLARLLEFTVIRLTEVSVPLRSQADTLQALKLGKVTPVFIPYSEAVCSLLSTSPEAPLKTLQRPDSRVFRVLLFGHWGPQKDLIRTLRAFHEFLEKHSMVRLTLAGVGNAHFPDSERESRSASDALETEQFENLGRVPEEQVLNLFLSHDLLLLPYNATGGYSGAMNAAALSGIEMIAYDLPQLRETAANLQLSVQFVPAGDLDAFMTEVEAAAARGLSRERRHVSKESLTSMLQGTAAALSRVFLPQDVVPR